MKDKIVTFGEIMLRLSPENNARFTQCNAFEAVYGGGEANTAVSLANFDVDANYVTKLPKHIIGQAAINSLRQYGVGVDHIVRGGDQIGIYFLEKKTSQRPTNVIYNRAGSAFALATADDFNWDEIFDGATWFHFSGITPAISDEMTNICITACQKAKEKGMTVSCDLNYRSKLWSSEKACEAMSRICQYVDVCIANEDDAIGIFSMNPADANGEEKNAYIAKELMKKFPFKEFFMHILDYIGAGDAYCAGLIYSLINNFDPQKAVEFANAASCLKHTVSGDYNLVTVDEVMKLAFSDAGNEVQR